MFPTASTIDCPSEVLQELHVNEEELANLRKAMEHGASLLDQEEADFRLETSLS